MSSGENALRRADQVRARRLQRREGKPLVGRAVTSRAPQIPSMVARNQQIEKALQRAGKTRRRLYLKLAETGTEVRLPSLPAVHIGWRAISGFVALICVTFLAAMAASPNFTVSRVEVQGAERLDANAVNSALQAAGKSIFSVERNNLIEILRDQFPEIERVSVSVGFPARVVVRVVERLPVVVWQQAGLTVWLDGAGVAFIPQDEGAGLIRVSAYEAPPELEGDLYSEHQLVKPEMVSTIQLLSQIAPADAPLIYDPKLGFGWTDPGGWQAFFGQDGHNVDQRLAIYITMLAELSARRLTPTLVSVAQMHAPYYRMDY